MFAKQALGLEISREGLRMVAVRGKRKLPALNVYSTHDFPEETVQFSFKELNITNPARFVGAVRETYARLQSSATRVSLSLPDSVGRVMLIDLETRFKNKREGIDLIRWKLKKGFPVDIDGINLDYQILRENESGGILTLVSVITRQVINQYEDLLLEAGLEPSHIDFNTFNLYRLFSERLGLSEDGAFITFYGGIVSITVFHEGILEFYRAKEIPSAMYEEERMFREISNSLLVYKKNNPGHSFSEVFCSAPLEEMKDFRRIVAEATEMEPSRLHAADFVSGGNGVFCDGNTLQSLSPALGAAMRNL